MTGGSDRFPTNFVQVKGKGALLNYWLTGRSQVDVSTGPQARDRDSVRGGKVVPAGGSPSSSPPLASPLCDNPSSSPSRAVAQSPLPTLARVGSSMPPWLGGGGALGLGVGAAPLRLGSPSSVLPLPPVAAPPFGALLSAFSADAADAVPAGDWLEQDARESLDSSSDIRDSDK